MCVCVGGGVSTEVMRMLVSDVNSPRPTSYAHTVFVSMSVLSTSYEMRPLRNQRQNSVLSTEVVIKIVTGWNPQYLRVPG